MKTKFLVLGFMLLLSFFSRAEKDYRSDHTVCEVQGESIDVDLRKHDRITSSEDDEYGETVRIRHGKKTTELNLTEIDLGRYRLLKTPNDICNKALALIVTPQEVAIFLLKDNRPFADTVMVLYYNTATKVADFMASKIQANSAIVRSGKTYFKLASLTNTPKFGEVTIKDSSFQFVEKTFEPWISFDGKNFKLDRDMTYQQFELRDLLKRSNLEALSEFREVKYKVARNPLTKKSCLSFADSDWTCE